MNNKKNKTAVVFGKFGLVHSGHLSLLEYAKSISIKLIVCVTNDEINSRSKDSISRSIQLVSRLSLADEVIFVDNIEEYLSIAKPDVVVKGEEFKNIHNPEYKVIKDYGGRLIFSTHRTELQFGKTQPMNRQNELLDDLEIYEFISFHKIDTSKIFNLLSGDRVQRFIVFGDIIVDKYINTTPLGLSQEEPVIVVTPESEEMFFGGAAVVANLANDFGVKTALFTLVGKEKENREIKAEIESKGIDGHFFSDFEAKTVTKLKYFIQGIPQMRVNIFAGTPPSLEYEDRVAKSILRHSNSSSCIIFSDFNYGSIPNSKIETIINSFREKGVIVAADSQTSSQMGRIGKFFSADFISLTEHEARVEMRDFESNLNSLILNICSQVKSKYVLLKLGSRGLMAAERIGDDWDVFSMNALNADPVDVSGAGDAMIVSACIALSSGLSFKAAVLIANISAGLQVGNIGHGQVSKDKILSWIKS